MTDEKISGEALMDMEDKVVDFHWFVLRAQRRHNYELSHILNMDETPMLFDFSSHENPRIHGQPNSSDFVMQWRQAEFHSCPST